MPIFRNILPAFGRMFLWVRQAPGHALRVPNQLLDRPPPLGAELRPVDVPVEARNPSVGPIASPRTPVPTLFNANPPGGRKRRASNQDPDPTDSSTSHRNKRPEITIQTQNLPPRNSPPPGNNVPSENQSDTSPLSPARSVSTPPDLRTNTNDDQDTADALGAAVSSGANANAYTIININNHHTPSARNVTLGRREERRRRHAKANNLANSGWPAPDVFLFRRITLRGYEPLLPKHWARELDTLYPELFIEEDQAYIKSANLDTQPTADCRASRAFYELMNIGVNTRMKVHLGKRGEIASKAAVKAYIEWSLRDLGLWKKRFYIPVLTIVSLPKNTGTPFGLEKVVHALQKLEQQWKIELDQQALATGSPKELPPLYAVVTKHSSIIYYSYIPTQSPVSPNDQLRHIATFKLQNAWEDVWTAFAVALLAAHCQDILIDALENKQMRDALVSIEQDD